jgi:drug/metabolite transporter (DMT)-like permease
MRFLFDLFGELAIALFFVAVFAGWEYLAYRTNRRFWMWVAGLAGIAVLIWFKGVGQMWSWMLGVGWLGVLCWADHKLHVEAKAAAAVAAKADEPERPTLTRRY